MDIIIAGPPLGSYVSRDPSSYTIYNKGIGQINYWTIWKNIIRSSNLNNFQINHQTHQYNAISSLWPIIANYHPITYYYILFFYKKIKFYFLKNWLPWQPLFVFVWVQTKSGYLCLTICYGSHFFFSFVFV